MLGYVSLNVTAFDCYLPFWQAPGERFCRESPLAPELREQQGVGDELARAFQNAGR